VLVSETEVTTADDAAPAEPDALLAEIAALRATAQQFTAATAQQHALAERREEVITRLHDELQRSRRGELDAALDLVRNSLIRLHDQILRQAAQLNTPLGVEELTGLLHALADDAADAVAQTGVERYTPKVGEPYNAAWHRPVGRAAAETPEAHNTVASAVAAGFAQDERIVRKAEVVVALWSSPAGAAEPTVPAPSPAAQ
jgi:molecular chaperone GrpE (heat shock protein)